MRRLYLTLLPLLCCGLAAGEAAAPTVRVRVSGLAGATLALRCAVPVTWRDSASGPALATVPAGTAMTLRTGTTLTASWSGEAAEARVSGKLLRVEAGDARPLEVTAGRTRRDYPGVLEFTPARGGFAVLNEAPLEEYVRGVLAAEAPASFHPEALKAMAVTVRTYATSCRGKHGTGADLCDGTHCQVYRGTQRIPRSVSDAAAATAGLFALHDGRPIEAVYSSDCGGWTESSENAWPGGKPLPYLRGVEDAPGPGQPAYCSINRSHSWRIPLSPSDFQRLVGGVGKARLAVTGATESGHVRKLSLFPLADSPAGEDAAPPAALALTELQPLKSFTGAQWRRMLGAERVRSMRFTVRCLDDGGAVVEGAGWGHGVGLCQFGAEGMARSAAAPDYTAILRHYYRGVTVGPFPTATAVAAGKAP